MRFKSLTWRMRTAAKLCPVGLAAALCLTPVRALAANAGSSADSEWPSIDWHLSPRLDFAVGIGHLSGSANEITYDTATGRQISRLDWKVENAAVLKGTADFAVMNWLSASLSGWTAIASNNVMDDYDWLVAPYQQWSDHSHHPDTRMPTAFQADVSIAARLYHAHDVSLSAVAGYQWTRFKWSVYGGSYTYSIAGFRDLTGTFPPNQLDITYSQSFHTPFVGIVGDVDLDDDWQLNFEAKGSPWGATASDIDYHPLRQLIFRDKISQSHLLAISAGATYNLDTQIQMTGKVSYQLYTLGKGPADMFDQTSGTNFHFAGDAAGLRNETLMTSLAIRFTFAP